MTERVKNRYEWLYRTLVVGLLGFVATFLLKAYNTVEHLSFDDAAQKQRVLEYTQQPRTISEAERERIMTHLEDTDRHMSSDEKEQLIIIRENQKRIGQDLQEIKNLIKQGR